MIDTNIPSPGIYRDIPFDVYLNWRHLSQSKVKAGRESMAHFHAAQHRESVQTDAMRLGRLFHAGQLEPLVIPTTYCVMPDFADDDANRTAKGEKPKNPRTTTYYKDRVAHFRHANREKEMVTAEEYERLVGVVSSISKNRRAVDYFSGSEQEVSFVWEDIESGITCKGRADSLSIKDGRITDLKKHDSPKDFGRVIHDLGYHIQAAMYIDGLTKVTGRSEWEFCIVTHTSQDPYICRAAPLGERDIQCGRDTYRAILRDIAQSQATGRWTGPPEPDAWHLPEFAYGERTEVELVIGNETMEV